MEGTQSLALKQWSIVARFLHEGEGIVTLLKRLDREERELALLPIYDEQATDALKPPVWMAWRHELRPPRTGHVYVRDGVEIADAVRITSLEALRGIEDEHAFTHVEAERLFREGEEPGLVALVLRVYHLARSFRFPDRAALEEGPAPFFELPEPVSLDGATPALSDEDFARRRRGVLRALKVSDSDLVRS